MKTTMLTPEIETRNDDFTEGTILFTHPFNEDVYARVIISQEMKNFMLRKSIKFSELWSSKFGDQEIKELEFMAEKFFDMQAISHEKPMGYIDPYEYYGVQPKDFY